MPSEEVWFVWFENMIMLEKRKYKKILEKSYLYSETEHAVFDVIRTQIQKWERMCRKLRYFPVDLTEYLERWMRSECNITPDVIESPAMVTQHRLMRKRKTSYEHIGGAYHLVHQRVNYTPSAGFRVLDRTREYEMLRHPNLFATAGQQEEEESFGDPIEVKHPDTRYLDRAIELEKLGIRCVDELVECTDAATFRSIYSTFVRDYSRFVREDYFEVLAQISGLTPGSARRKLYKLAVDMTFQYFDHKKLTNLFGRQYGPTELFRLANNDRRETVRVMEEACPYMDSFQFLLAQRTKEWIETVGEHLRRAIELGTL